MRRAVLGCTLAVSLLSGLATASIVGDAFKALRELVVPPPPTCPGVGIFQPPPIKEVDRIEARVGCRFESVRWFQDWNTHFDTALARSVLKRGAVPELSWQPRVLLSKAKGGQSARYRGVMYRDIAAGLADPYLKRFAQDVKRLGTTVNIAFAPEMNGDWGVYQLTKTNTAKQFIAAHRHIVNLFRREGASKARWVWTPNIIYPQATASFKQLFPGDAFVDVMGLDGYNWGATHRYNLWLTFGQTFGPSYKALKALSNKPIQLAEVSSAEKGGSKAEWIANMCAVIGNYSQIKSLVWFNMIERADWRIDSSEASLKAFSSCMKRRIADRDRRQASSR